ncbi:MauE/DoxX family redox-associated membrane protein [Terrabacter sp. NPDC080008]|uniref:MauE/DoxX family redox-associated membrane protein n=1 Tax=Terrabacter sp. NPDC080008 TaxID=3155176 RepID=UPI00344C6A2F
MPTDALALAPALLAVVLVVSAVGKLRSPEESARAFRDLRVPQPLANSLVAQSLPWGELVLAVGMVLAGSLAAVVVDAVTLLLFAAYLVLVVRALGFDEDVDCACFGSLAPGRVTRRTVVRNAWLVALAAIALVAAASGGSVVARVADGRLPWWWLLGAAAAAVTTVLVLGTGQAGAVGDGGTEHLDGQAVEEGDYVRSRTPALPVTLGDGTETDLRALSSARAQLLLFVSEGCGSCGGVIAATAQWAAELPELDVRHVLEVVPGVGTLTRAEEPRSVHDPAHRLWDSFGVRGTPSAVLLGADGLLAGGPVTGAEHVPGFVADIRAELQAARADAQTVVPGRG